MAFCSLIPLSPMSIITEHSPLLLGLFTGANLQLIITDDSRYQPSLSFPSLAS